MFPILGTLCITDSRMPRKYVPIFSNCPIHVYARCINREWFGLPLPVVWSIMEDYLKFISVAYNIKIVSFVLMANHFHLILYSPDKNLSAAMNYFMRETSRQISFLTGRINQTYGGRFRRSLILNQNHFNNVYKYVYRNPVKAGIVIFAEDYTFSTLNGLVGKNKLFIPLKEDRFFFNSPEFALNWINRNTLKEDDEVIRKALRRKIFQLPKKEKSTQLHHLEKGSY